MPMASNAFAIVYVDIVEEIFPVSGTGRLSVDIDNHGQCNKDLHCNTDEEN